MKKRYSKWDVFVGSFPYRTGLPKWRAARIADELRGCVQNVCLIKNRSRDVG